jgi:DNA repair protein SbcC/Rad50
MKIILENFRCYEKSTFDFGNKGTVLISGGSGVGKTSILMAIQFCLFGTGTNLVSVGKTFCSVEIQFLHQLDPSAKLIDQREDPLAKLGIDQREDEINIISVKRTKRPNRLTVLMKNNTEEKEDQVAQEIINRKFGLFFQTCGYISQNAINSFVLMNPIDKLAFLEKIAFQDFDLLEVKLKCKNLIKETNENLLSIQSKIELTKSLIQNTSFAGDQTDSKFSEKVEYPFQFKKNSTRNEIQEKNEAVRYKNCITKIKIKNKELERLSNKLLNLKVYSSAVKSKNEELLKIQNQIKQKESELQNLSFLTENDKFFPTVSVNNCLEESLKIQIKFYRQELNQFLKEKEYHSLLKNFNSDEIKLEKIKMEENEKRIEEISLLKKELWEEYTKEESEKVIINSKLYLEDLKTIVRERKKFKEAIKFYTSDESELKNWTFIKKFTNFLQIETEKRKNLDLDPSTFGKTQVYSNVILDLYSEICVSKDSIDHWKSLLEKIKMEKELYVCPGCNINLHFNDGELTTTNQKIEKIEFTEEDVVSKINSLKTLIKNKERELKNFERLNETLFQIYENIYPIIDSLLKKHSETEKETESFSVSESPCETNLCWEIFEKTSVDDIKEIEDDIEYIQNYIKEQNSKIEKIKILEKGDFSSGIKSFERDIETRRKILLQQNTKEKLKEEFCKINKEEFDEEKTRSKINSLESISKTFSNLKKEIFVLETNRKKYEQEIKKLKEETLLKIFEQSGVSKEKEEILLNEKIILFQEEEKNLKNEIKLIETQKNQYFQNLEKLEKYKQYEKELKNINSLKNSLKEFEKQENILREECAAALILKEKIIEAESISLYNIIESINSHAQIYLEDFFPENPITVRLLPFKEIKKKTTTQAAGTQKPQINLEIEYKGIECGINSLSGGELSRVILAFTLALGDMFNIPLLMLDECTSSLDQDLNSIVFESIKQHFGEKLVLVIAHQVVSGCFDKVVKMV